MKVKILAKRYGDAFAAYAKGQSGPDRMVEDIRSLKSVFRDETGLLGFFASPGVNDAEKCAFIDKVFSGTLSGEFVFFLKLLVGKRRIGLLEEIVEYIRVTYAHGEAVPALLTTSYPLDLDTIKEVEESLEKKFDRKLSFFLGVDSSLLGGVKVVVGNAVIDGSIKLRLEELGKKLKTARVV